MKNISIIGNGAMGTVCAIQLCANNNNITMWGHSRDELMEIQSAGENTKFLPGYKLPETLKYEPNDSKILGGAELVISAVPCQFTRGVWERLKAYAKAEIPIVSVTKGIENNSLLRPSQILADVIGSEIKAAALSGPTIADELARNLPASATAACIEEKIAEDIQLTFSSETFRIYRNTDIIGVELAGAMKNVIAIAAGILDGIGAGDNAKAALLSRGLAEITSLGTALGANEKTFAGLSGLGDLVTTCISPKGRNRSFGQRIGRGMSLKKAIEATDSVVEGLPTCESVIELAKKNNIEMPITESVYSVLFENVSVQDALNHLMTRSLKAE